MAYLYIWLGLIILFVIIGIIDDVYNKTMIIKDEKIKEGEQ